MTTETPWLVSQKPNRSANVRLFCLPYAGGGASIFGSWQKNFSDTVEVCPVQLPGRGLRIEEPSFTEMNELVRIAGQALAPHLDKPFAFFGHSMGALVAFELARHIRREYSLQPIHLFVSGRCSPQTSRGPFNSHVSDFAFAEILRRNNGIPKEALEDPELMELVLPIIRADFALCESYVYAPESPFSFPITAFGGLNDYGAPRDCIESWHDHTTGPFVVRMFPGDHFFLNALKSPLLEVIAKELEQDVREKGISNVNAR